MSNFVHLNSLNRTARDLPKPAKYESPYPQFVPVRGASTARAIAPRQVASAADALVTADTPHTGPDLSTFSGRLQQRWRSAGLAALGALSVIGALPFAAPAAAASGVAAVFIAGGLATTFVGAGLYYSARGQ
jgi:hypothetical protein